MNRNDFTAIELILRAEFKRRWRKRIWHVLEPWLVGALLGAAVGLMFCAAWIHSL